MSLKAGYARRLCLTSGLLLLAVLAVLSHAPSRGQSVWKTDSKTLSVRNAHSLVYDNVQQAVILFGGADAIHVCADTWQWDGKKRTWEFASAEGPGPRTFAAFAYDDSRHEAILFGGNRVLFGTGNEADSFLGIPGAFTITAGVRCK